MHTFVTVPQLLRRTVTVAHRLPQAKQFSVADLWNLMYLLMLTMPYVSFPCSQILNQQSAMVNGKTKR